MPCRTVLPQKPPVAQLLIQFPVFYTTHQFITIFTTAPLTPSHPIRLAHPPSVLTYILHWTTQLLRSTCSVHFKHNADTPKWGGEGMWDINKSSNPLFDEAPTSSLTKLMLKYIITFAEPNKNDNDKDKRHAKMHLLIRHNQNPNITKVQMLMVLLQWVCGEVWEREFRYLWQQGIFHLLCHHLCCLVYIYIHNGP